MVKFSWKLKKEESVGNVKVEDKVQVSDVPVEDVSVSIDAPLDSVAEVVPLPVIEDKTRMSTEAELLKKVEVEEAQGASEVSAKDDAVGRELLTEKRDPMDVFGKAFGGQKPTLDGNIAELTDSTKNISMKTKIHDVQALSVWEFVGKSAERERLSDGTTLKEIADMYGEFATLIKTNSCSEDGWRANQLERIYTARREVEDLMPPMNKTDALLGRGKR